MFCSSSEEMAHSCFNLQFYGVKSNYFSCEICLLHFLIVSFSLSSCDVIHLSFIHKRLIACKHLRLFMFLLSLLLLHMVLISLLFNWIIQIAMLKLSQGANVVLQHVKSLSISVCRVGAVVQVLGTPLLICPSANIPGMVGEGGPNAWPAPCVETRMGVPGCWLWESKLTDERSLSLPVWISMCLSYK